MLQRHNSKKLLILAFDVDLILQPIVLTLFIITTLFYSLTIEEFLMHPFSMYASHIAQHLYQKLLYS